MLEARRTTSSSERAEVPANEEVLSSFLEVDPNGWGSEYQLKIYIWRKVVGDRLRTIVPRRRKVVEKQESKQWEEFQTKEMGIFGFLS
jgi:hypothetical protein